MGTMVHIDTYKHILEKLRSYGDTWPQVKNVTNVAAMYKQMGKRVHMGTNRHILDKPSAMNSCIVHMVKYGHIQTHGHILTKANLLQNQTNGT